METLNRCYTKLDPASMGLTKNLKTWTPAW